jgi:hypothetical protein
MPPSQALVPCSCLEVVPMAGHLHSARWCQWQVPGLSPAGSNAGYVCARLDRGMRDLLRCAHVRTRATW